MTSGARRARTCYDPLVEKDALQERYAPKSTCFGCGPANSQGLRIRSVPHGDEVTCDWTPLPHHEAFPGVVNGGIIGTLLDCHSNWTAAHALMTSRGLEHPPCTVTSEYSVQLKRPTPSNQTLHLSARAVAVEGDRVTVESKLEANGKICALGRGVFVAVQPGHPAYHRW
jgi:acyl-coenzyme A thioesterase PaaI-like protein